MSEKEVLSDFSELFQENYDRIPKELAQLSVSFKNLNTWLIREIPKEEVVKEKPKLVYQYLDSILPVLTVLHSVGSECTLPLSYLFLGLP